MSTLTSVRWLAQDYAYVAGCQLRSLASAVPPAAYRTGIGRAVVSQYLAEHDLWDTAIVAHSNGGLIGKYAMLKTPAAARIARLVAICSPFSGSRYARYALAPSLRAFAPTHATTRLLVRGSSVNRNITSIFGSFDPMIPTGSELPGARNTRVDVPGHFRILGAAATIATVLREVAVPS